MDEIIEVSEKELAEYLGLSGRRIRQLYKEGVVFKRKGGKYDLKKSVLEYIKFLRGSDKDENFEKVKLANEVEKLSHERLKKRKTEIQVMAIEKKMHAQEDVEYFWNTMVLAAKSKLTAIPVKCAPVLVGIENRKEIQAILKREINEALNEISEYDVNKFDSEPEESDDGTE